MPFLRSYLSVRDRRPPEASHPPLWRASQRPRPSVRQIPFCAQFPLFKRTSLYSPLSSALRVIRSYINNSHPHDSHRLHITGRCVPALPSLKETIGAKSPQIIDDRHHPLDILYILLIPNQLGYPQIFMTTTAQLIAGQVTYTRASPTVVFFSHVLFGVQRHYPSS